MAKRTLALAPKADPPKADPLMLPSRISDQEAAYLQHLNTKHLEMQKAMQAALNEFLAHLSTIYQIDGSKGDRLNLDGTIIRATRAPEGKTDAG